MSADTEPAKQSEPNKKVDGCPAAVDLLLAAEPAQPVEPSFVSKDHDIHPDKWWMDRKFVLEVLGFAVLVAYTVFACLQWLQIRWTNQLTREALNGGNENLRQTLAKMQGQTDATNNLYGEAQKQTVSAATVADNSRIQAAASNIAADAAKSAAETAKDTLHVSQRAYLSAGVPSFDWPLGRVRIPILNLRHIPSGRVTIILHEVTLISPQARVTAVAIERHWNRTSITSVYSTQMPFELSTTLPKADVKSLNDGRNSITLVGSITYNVGFTTSPEQHWPICYKTHLEEVGKDVIWSFCDASGILPVVEKNDSYPSKEDQVQYP